MKKLKVLHVLSQVELTGAEVYALTLAEHQIAAGHEVFVVSDKLHTPTRAQYIPYRIHQRTMWARLRNIWFLAKFVRGRHIDVVHAHSRAASWVANFALKLSRVPLVSTVHGRQHWHGRWRKNDVYGEQMIAVCENIRSHLIHDFRISPQKVVTVANPVEWKGERTPGASDQLFISVLGRTSGPKGEKTSLILEKVIPSLLQKYPFVRVGIAGGPLEKLAPSARRVLTDLLGKYPSQIEFASERSDFWRFLLRADLVIGSGRIAIESLGREIPTFAQGEAVSHGLVNQFNLAKALASNFGDVHAERDREVPLIPEKVLQELNHWIAPAFEEKKAKGAVPFDHAVAVAVRDHFATAPVLRRVEQIYRLNILRKKLGARIPVLMYHKIPEAPLASKHKIFVTRAVFEWQMRWLKRRGFETVGFADLKAFLSGMKPLSAFPKKPVMITFDDGYRDNLENAFPLLKELGFKSTVFVLANSKITQNQWDLDMDPTEPASPLMNVDELKRSLELGVSIGSHGCSHRFLTDLSEAESLDEMKASKLKLESELNTPILAFAYPYGKFSREHEQQAFQAGYEFAVSTDSGGMRLEDNPYAIFRVNVFPHDTGWAFFKKTHKYYRLYFRWKRGS